MNWKINGRTLGDASTAVLIDHDSLSGGIVWNHASYVQRGTTPLQQRTTKGPNSYRLRFRVIGDKAGIGLWVDRIIEELEDPVFTLYALHADPPRIFRNAVRIALRATTAPHVVEQGLSTAVIEVTCILEGIWITDGGSFCQVVGGVFTKTATGYRDEFGNEAASGLPEVRLPEQKAGYPIARKPNGSTGTPTLLRKESDVNSDGDTVFFDVYDFTGYLTPTPTATGDVAVWEACQVPSDGYLSTGGSLQGAYGGVGTMQVGAFQAGTA